MSRGYFFNSLKARRDDLTKESRLLEYRLTKMEQMNHPDTADQKILLDLNRQMIELIDNQQGTSDR